MPVKALSCPRCSALLTESQRMRMMTESQRMRLLTESQRMQLLTESQRMRLTESQRMRMHMSESERARIQRSSLATLWLILGICSSVMLGVYVRAVMQSNLWAIGTVIVGVCITFCWAQFEK